MIDVIADYYQSYNANIHRVYMLWVKKQPTSLNKPDIQYKPILTFENHMKLFLHLGQPIA